MSSQQLQRGYLTISVIVFSGVFATILGGLIGFIFVQNRSQVVKEHRERAIQIAEGGLDYYKWYLAHYPNDLTNSQGGGLGPLPYSDPEGGAVGEFELEVNGETFCGVTSAVEIESTGWTNEEPNQTRTVYGKYARPSVAEYSYIINSSVWAGPDRTIRGPYHSNGGVRMDGDNQSTVSSAVEDWICTSSFGCSPNQNVDGVFGGGSSSELWEYPVPQVDFGGITVDLVAMKDLAQDEGLYFSPDEEGRRLVFQSNGTVSVYTVDDTDWVWGLSTEDGWHRNYHIIDDDDFVGNFDIPDDCPVIFVEDDVWLEGEVDGKVAVASANLIQPNVDTTIILNNNITYTDDDGSSGLTAIAEEDILIPLLSPNNMELRGIFIAQNGHFGRNHYDESDLPWYYDDYVERNNLIMVGTIVSNGRVGTQWTSGGSFSSGYQNRENYYDRDLATAPPPLTPSFNEEFTFVEWLEVE